LGILDIGSYYHSRVPRWAGHVARMPMNRAPRKLLTFWVAHPRPIGHPEMNFGRTLKKALKRNNLPTDFATLSAIARDRPTHSTPTPSFSTPNPPTPSPSMPALRHPTSLPANLNAPLPGYGNLAPAYVVPAWHAPLAQAQYAETRTAARAARYAARANRANAPLQQHHPAQGIALGNYRRRF
jgi:hypothetical protein